MPNQNILNGLKSALERGQSLEQAMLSFYNAGFSKQEVEEAAGAINTQPQQVQPTTTSSVQEKKPIQKVSGYGQSKNKNLLMIIWISLLAVALGLLIVVFIFREQIIDFFGGL